MNVLASARGFVAVVMRQLGRDRTALFFMLVLPIVVIVIIGLTFGSAGGIDVGILDGSPGSTSSTAIIDGIDAADGTGVVVYDSIEELQRAVRRRNVAAGLVLPAELDAAVTAGDTAITFVALADGQSSQLARDVVVSALADVLAPADAARFAADLTGADAAAATGLATMAGGALPPLGIDVVDVGPAQQPDLSPFSRVAPQQLVLFVFINAMASGAALVRMRRTGVLRRVLAGPGGAGTIVGGLLAAWLVVSLVESGLIVAVGAVAFDVDWGSPLAAAALVVTFAFVGAGAGLIVGAVGGNEDRVGAITPPIGLVLGALGGCMVPLELFSPTMLRIAHVTPQYWAMTAWQRLVFDGASLSGIAGPLAVLAGFAALFVAAAVVTLRRALVRA